MDTSRTRVTAMSQRLKPTGPTLRILHSTKASDKLPNDDHFVIITSPF